MRLSKTLLISAALAAFMAVAVAQHPAPMDMPTADAATLPVAQGPTPTGPAPTAIPTTEAVTVPGGASDEAAGAFFFSDDDDSTGGDDGTADGADGDDAGDDGDQQASALVKRGRRHHGRRGRSGKTIALKNQRDFCLLLPQHLGGNIAKTEATAMAHCLKPHDRSTPGARAFPRGFFRSTHFMRGNRYIQVTGRFDRSKYHLRNNDQGGQNGRSD